MNNTYDTILKFSKKFQESPQKFVEIIKKATELIEEEEKEKNTVNTDTDDSISIDINENKED
jgi:hypothetical protein